MGLLPKWCHCSAEYLIISYIVIIYVNTVYSPKEQWPPSLAPVSSHVSLDLGLVVHEQNSQRLQGVHTSLLVPTRSERVENQLIGMESVTMTAAFEQRIGFEGKYEQIRLITLRRKRFDAPMGRCTCLEQLHLRSCQSGLIRTGWPHVSRCSWKSTEICERRNFSLRPSVAVRGHCVYKVIYLVINSLYRACTPLHLLLFLKWPLNR